MSDACSNPTLLQALDHVQDRTSFLIFVRTHITDWHAEHADAIRHPRKAHPLDTRDWKTGTIEGSLKAAVAWAESSLDETPS